MDSEHLLVPVKVQALVIDDSVVKQSGVVQYEGNRYRLGAGRWSPQVYNYQQLLNNLSSPGPPPFYGATRKYDGKDADQLILENKTHQDALPTNADRGVYLHWVLPAGLRRASTPNSLDFPPLPDHWLIIRFSRKDSNLKTRAWFIDGGAVVTDGSKTTLLFPRGDEYAARRVGQVIPLEDIATAKLATERTQITAVGNGNTSSPTFTAFIGENRNIFSWHDKLEDLRTPQPDGKVPEDTTLTYCVLGWYRDPQNEPLPQNEPRKQNVSERRDATNKLLGWLIDPLGWSIDANSATTVNLLNRRSVFHGMVAHINYWSGTTYKGQMLGYPGAPLVAGSMGKSKAAFKVGVGNSAEDALVSLVSSEYSGDQRPSSLQEKQPGLWKALEAVIYRQSETLIKSWNVAPRDMTVHQNSFATHEAGKFWYIRPPAENRGVFPADADKTAAEVAAQPTAEHLTKLKELNQLQTEVDTVSRDLAALQQDLYMRWWKVCKRSREDIPTTEKKHCDTLIAQVKTLRDKLNELNARLEPLPRELKTKLDAAKLELKYDAAPRFWIPADPVIVVKNCGSPDKHQFPREHPCRLPEQIITGAKVTVGTTQNTLNTPAGVADIAAAAQRHLPKCPPIVNELLNEASIVEQTIRDLAERTLPASKSFRDEDEWSQWTQRLVKDLTAPHKVSFQPQASNIRADSLVDLWVRQPWAPLFLDWQITWFPTTESPTAEHPFGAVWSFGEVDFAPQDKKLIPKDGYTVRGRSLLSPINDRLFNDPIETLGDMLDSRRDAKHKDASFPPAVIQILERYEVVWSETLSQLPRGGLMGQALTGFHQALLRRDVTLPRINPDATRPWIANDDEWIENDELKSYEKQVKELLDIRSDGVSGESLSPPFTSKTSPGVPFSLIRAGAMRIDELWLIDDFGQFADLLGLTSAGSTSSGQVFHPRMRWDDDRTRFAMPPRVLQPVRINFRFTAATQNRNEITNPEPALSSICGWIFYNPLDHALVLCDQKGELMGHLVIVKDGGGFRITWEAGAGGVAIDQVSNPTLKAFAQSLIQSTTTSKPRLLELLKLIDKSLERIRPSGGRRESILVGRPLALVNASIGLELFGNAWSNPQTAPVVSPGTGDAKLDALQVRVNLGYARNVEDGLIGYFKAGAYNRIVVPQLPDTVTTSEYIGDPAVHALRVGFGAPQPVTLLMDPWGSVQAACGIVPAKTITLAHPELNKTVAKMEASFHVGPVLLQPNRLALPTPTGNTGTWNFSGPLTEEKAAPVIPLDPRYFSDQPLVAAEGRLLLLNEE